MPQSYYNVEQTAKLLGVSEADVKQMIQNRELHAYRAGADWKFKVEEIDQLVKQRQQGAGDDNSEVLLSEVELGQSDIGTSGTVIGMGKGSLESDIQLADESSATGGTARPAAGKSKELESKVSQFEELDLTLEEDVTLEDSTVGGKPKSAPKPGAKPAEADSNINLGGSALEDDDLVLGGSGTGSDVTIGGDSGISLVDPADSGLSLEEPLELVGGSNVESLELGEDDLLAAGDAPSAKGKAPMKTDDDFLLTPLEETGEGEDSESGSQVIALDSEADESATMVASKSAASMAAMLDEDLSTQTNALDLAAAAPGAIPLAAQPAALAQGAPLMQAEMALPETPYSIWLVISLALCAVLLLFCGMMMYDLLRNMWSWDNPYTVNSSLMDWILSFFEGK